MVPQVFLDNLPLSILAFCAVSAVAVEGISYLLGMGRSSVAQQVNDLKAKEAQLAELKAKTKRNENAEQVLEKQVAEMQQALVMPTTISQLIPTTVFMLIIMPNVMKLLKNKVFCQLPITIAWPFSIVLQGSLEAPGPHDVSMTFFYFVCMAVARSYAKKLYPQLPSPQAFGKPEATEAPVEDRKTQ